MSNAEMISLAERCEQASGPDRELDAAIWDAAGMVDESQCLDWCSMNGRTDLTRERFVAACSPAFTASIDTAMTLVRKGFEWTLEAEETEIFWPASSPWTYRAELGDPMRGWKSECSTPALALCAAALRAASEGEAG